jgi:hypothetical protein
MTSRYPSCHGMPAAPPMRFAAAAPPPLESIGSTGGHSTAAYLFPPHPSTGVAVDRDPPISIPSSAHGRTIERMRGRAALHRTVRR